MTLNVNGSTVVDINRNVILGSGPTDPASPAIGTLWNNTKVDSMRFFNGSFWINVIPGSITAWAWGSNNYGQLGDGTATTASKSSPVSVVGGFTDWIQISSGGSHTTAIRGVGVLWAWGRNSDGQLGDGTTTTRSNPVNGVGNFTDWIQISSGDRHTTAVRANGTAWAWGSNSNGRLGDNSSGYRNSPVSVVGNFTDWIQISSGGSHTTAVRANGTAWAWGWNFNAQLGDNTTTERSSPVSVVGGFTDWIQISSGDRHTTALRANGTAWAWGSNGSGRLGDNTIIQRSSPVSVVGNFTDWIQISSGTSHTTAVRANGTAWAWGSNISGRLGDNTTTDRSSPVSVVGGFTDWIQISAGQTHTTAVRANGTAWAWGSNGSSQLGDNSANTASKSSPVSVVGGFTDWIQISSGNNHTTALR